MIDLYCERVGAGLAGEPLNALTNVFFLLAAAFSLRDARQRRHAAGVMLAWLLGLIGVGSALFHTFATAWAQWCDVIPIALFQVGYLATYCRELKRWSTPAVVAACVTLVLLLAGAAVLPPWLNGSLGYLPAVAVLIILGVDYYVAEHNTMLLAAAALFMLSLTARSVDQVACAAWPHGTHWLWHSLNALVLYRVLTALGRSARWRAAFQS